MRKYQILYYILFITCSRETIFSQTNCNKELLTGTWLCADTYIYSKDSLTREKLDILLNNSIKDKGWSWTFDTTGNRVSAPDTKTVNYKIDENGCKIIYGQHKKTTRLNTTKILYVDDKYLVLEIPNRHSQTTCSFRKKGHN
jgi:hypothetical protein